MSRMIKGLLLVGIFAGLAACDSGHTEKAVAEEHVWQGQLDSLEKAKGIEATLMESAARQSKAIDDVSSK